MRTAFQLLRTLLNWTSDFARSLQNMFFRSSDDGHLSAILTSFKKGQAERDIGFGIILVCALLS